MRRFDVIKEWMDAIEGLIKECPCDHGCPSCVYDSLCGSGNDLLNKAGALFLLQG